MTELERISHLLDNVKAAKIDHVIDLDPEDFKRSSFILHEDHTEEEFKSFKEFMGHLEINDASELWGTIWLKDDDAAWLETVFDSDGYGGTWYMRAIPPTPKRTVEEVD